MSSVKAVVLRRWSWAVVPLAVILAPQVLNDYWLYALSIALVWGIGAIGYNVLLGNTGQVSLAPAAFYAIGAYSITLLANAGAPLIVGALVGVVAAILISLLLGLITLRLSGFYLALSTLSLATLVQQVAGSQRSLTGGWGGITAPSFTWFNSGFGRVVDDFYTVALAALVIAVLTHNLLRSYFGRALATVKDAELAAGSAGIDPLRYKLMAFVISGVYAAIGGCFYTGLVGYIDPSQFGLSLTVGMVGLTVLGGLGSVPGSLIGAGFFVIAPQLFQAAKTVQIIAFGVSIMLAIVLLPGGIVSLFDRRRLRSVPWIRRTAMSTGHSEAESVPRNAGGTT